MRAGIVISCEHASAAVPAPYRHVFRGAGAALRSHRGSDLGARTLSRQLAQSFGAPLVAARATRLLADPNRSRRSPRLFSEWSRRLDAVERERAVGEYWSPHRKQVEHEIRRLHRDHGQVVHVSVHTFTPCWRGARRPVDVALLYDPSRPREREFAATWLTALAELQPGLELRRNYPYRGVADGLTTHLRRNLDPETYLGLELEVSQRFPLGAPAVWRRIRRAVADALRETVAGWPAT